VPVVWKNYGDYTPPTEFTVVWWISHLGSSCTYNNTILTDGVVNDNKVKLELIKRNNQYDVSFRLYCGAYFGTSVNGGANIVYPRAAGYKVITIVSPVTHNLTVSFDPPEIQTITTQGGASPSIDVTATVDCACNNFQPSATTIYRWRNNNIDLSLSGDTASKTITILGIQKTTGATVYLDIEDSAHGQSHPNYKSFSYTVNVTGGGTIQ
jgi:hypothetical protein